MGVLQKEERTKMAKHFTLWTDPRYAGYLESIRCDPDPPKNQWRMRIMTSCIRCSECNGEKALEDTSTATQSILEVVADPSKYISDDEYFVCGHCVNKKGVLRRYNLLQSFKKEGEQGEEEDFTVLLSHRFSKSTGWYPYYHASYHLYNPRHDYYIDFASYPITTSTDGPYPSMTTLVYRGTDPRRYDPYYKIENTLFNLLLVFL